MNNLKLNGTKPSISDEAFSSDKSAFLLISDVAHLIFTNLKDMIDDTDLQRSEMLLMNELNLYDGRNQLDLVKATYLKPPTVSVALAKLEARGYVKRVINENDHRSVLVYLDERGKEYCRNIRELIIGMQEDSLIGLTETEKEELVKGLAQIRKRLINKKKGRANARPELFFGMARGSFELESPRVKLVVSAFFAYQLLVASPLDDLSVVKNHDHIRIHDSRKPVGYDEHRSSFHQLVHTSGHYSLGTGVYGGRRLVEDHHRRVCDGGSRDGEQLALAL